MNGPAPPADRAAAFPRALARSVEEVTVGRDGLALPPSTCRAAHDPPIRPCLEAVRNAFGSSFPEPFDRPAPVLAGVGTLAP